MTKKTKNKSAKLDRNYLVDADVFLKEELKDPEFRRAYEEEGLKFKIAQAVYKRRKARNLSQAALAQKARTTQKVISRIEHSDVSVGVDLLQRIASALDLKVSISLR